jgi:1,4-dihydroxy-2-naphthoyl-CoA hydrolase
MALTADEQERINVIANAQPPFAQLIAITVVSADLDEVILEMKATEPISNRNGVLHGGALAALADNAGGTFAFVNLKPDQGTTTMESKINYFRPVEIGDTVRATSVGLHKGRTTIVVLTTMTRGDGKVAAVAIQTQMVLTKR